MIVGGAGGIGVEVAEQLRALGARVVSASRRGPEPDVVQAPREDGDLVAVGVDLTRPATILALAAWVEREFGGLDILVNTAGMTRSVPLRAIEQLDDDTIDEVVTSNASGVLRIIRDLTPALRRGHAPCVVNVSSVAARTGVGSNVAYVGAKAAMDAMTIALAKALAPEIRFVNVAPSALDTDFAKGRGPEFIARTIAATPLGRLATPREVANAVLAGARLLIMTTGSTIYVDGGRHL
ncbi:MAG: hypothetical protein ABS78_01065 [Phenylobacterium sp. SCN 70-31]|nr:MAG: hypothetical protein ABS78_01065 [Phenylobacterium sp. SCN 70-31]